jgi:hypothetical protein
MGDHRMGTASKTIHEVFIYLDRETLPLPLGKKRVPKPPWRRSLDRMLSAFSYQPRHMITKEIKNARKAIAALSADRDRRVLA